MVADLDERVNALIAQNIPLVSDLQAANNPEARIMLEANLNEMGHLQAERKEFEDSRKHIIDEAALIQRRIALGAASGVSAIDKGKGVENVDTAKDENPMRSEEPEAPEEPGELNGSSNGENQSQPINGQSTTPAESNEEAESSTAIITVSEEIIPLHDSDRIPPGVRESLLVPGNVSAHTNTAPTAIQIRPATIKEMREEAARLETAATVLAAGMSRPIAKATPRVKAKVKAIGKAMASLEATGKAEATNAPETSNNNAKAKKGNGDTKLFYPEEREHEAVIAFASVLMDWCPKMQDVQRQIGRQLTKEGFWAKMVKTIHTAPDIPGAKRAVMIIILSKALEDKLQQLPLQQYAFGKYRRQKGFSKFVFSHYVKKAKKEAVAKIVKKGKFDQVLGNTRN
ncbi:hypothetical protein NPX13_g11085 [Xylaria arbuscula]|uniref:Uncharacterized protein n=1 Tax=Xylaria arbuscula TaxID=114810 RepID=A0A9W8N3G9_9PEZI|nr:hypothetical protein NPX13_g11085 [Xylaria arbuscula]